VLCYFYVRSLLHYFLFIYRSDNDEESSHSCSLIALCPSSSLPSLPHCPAAPRSHCSPASLPYCTTSSLPHYYPACLSRCPMNQLCRCSSASLLHCPTAFLFHYPTSSMSHCLIHLLSSNHTLPLSLLSHCVQVHHGLLRHHFPVPMTPLPKGPDSHCITVVPSLSHHCPPASLSVPLSSQHGWALALRKLTRA
jgi:hypothetical protein